MSNDNKALKTAFAEALLRSPEDVFKAALSVIPDTGLALQAANLWPEDTFVKAERIRLMSECDPKEFLPSKSQQAKDIYSIAQDARLDEDVRIKAHQLYAQIMGHIDKNPGVAISVTNNSVLLVPDKGNDEDWEKGAIIQQRMLISDSNASTQ